MSVEARWINLICNQDNETAIEELTEEKARL